MVSPSFPTPAESYRTLEEFLEELARLQAYVEQSQVDKRSLHAAFLAAQQLYQQRLLPTLEALADAEEFTAYCTEINRSLRLLGMDVSFLQSAQQPMTIQKRQSQMRQRLQNLQEFSSGLKQALETSAPD